MGQNFFFLVRKINIYMKEAFLYLYGEYSWD